MTFILFNVFVIKDDMIWLSCCKVVYSIDNDKTYLVECPGST
jgi:hypothetical protein